MYITELQEDLQNLTKQKIKITQLAEILGVSSQNMDYKSEKGEFSRFPFFFFNLTDIF